MAQVTGRDRDLTFARAFGRALLRELDSGDSRAAQKLVLDDVNRRRDLLPIHRVKLWESRHFEPSNACFENVDDLDR